MTSKLTLSTRNFYGSGNEDSPFQKRVKKELALRHSTAVVSHPFYACLTQGDDIWNIFSRQKDAMDYLNKEKEPNVRMFSFESPNGPPGKRHYVVCTAQRFWHEYIKIGQRHCYEIVLENRPCRLYFDVEFYRAENPCLDGELCVQNFADFVCEELLQQFGLKVDKQRHILDLAASTDEKFSRHLIFHLPGKMLFRSNSDMGIFVSKLRIKHPEPSKESNGDHLGLWVKNRSGVCTPIWDEAVYTRNRNFRLFLSTKLGHKNPLKLANSCNFYEINPSDEAVFHDSLITLPNASEEQFLFVVSDNKCSIPEHRKKLPVLSKPGKEGCGPSPYPKVDDFILKVVKQRKSSAFLRSWKLFESVDEEPLIIYEVGGCKYCFNIEREHRSNHVMWIADLQRNVYYQKCHDPDCRSLGFRSNQFPLDETLWTKKSSVVPLSEHNQHPNVSDQALCDMMSELEKQGVI